MDLSQTIFKFANKKCQRVFERFLLPTVFHWQFLISDIFSTSLKFEACYISDSNKQTYFIKNATLWRLKNATVLMFHAFLTFFVCLFFFAVFHHKICVFIILISFFWWIIKFPQQNINQSEIRVGDKKLSVGFGISHYISGQIFYKSGKLLQIVTIITNGGTALGGIVLDFKMNSRWLQVEIQIRTCF